MSNRSGFLSYLAPPHRRNQGSRRQSERETQRRTSAANTPNPDRNRSTPNIATGNQSGAPTPTATPSSGTSSDINPAVPVLNTSDAWRLGRSEVGFKGLTDATEQAASLYSRLAETRDYLDSAESVWEELCVARQQLQNSLDCATSPDEILRFSAIRTLGNIYSQLGDYDMAHKTFLLLCPSFPLTRAEVDGLFPTHKIDALLCYMGFATITGRNLDLIETVARALPWAAVDILRTEDRKRLALFNLIRALNFRGCHEDASRNLRIFEMISQPGTPQQNIEYLLQKAIATAWESSESVSHDLFVDVFIISSCKLGIWSRRALDILYHFARALKVWGRHDAALELLIKSCQGYYYTFGASHPRAVRIYKELISCEGAKATPQCLRQLNDERFSRKRKWSIAYECNYLVTPIELLKSVTTIDYDRVLRTLERLLKEKGLSKRVKFNIRRNLAWCAIEQDRLNSASTALYNLHTSINEIGTDIVRVEAFRATLAADEAICSAKSSDGLDFMRQRSKLVYLGFKDFPKERNHQIKAILRRMTTYGLTHFTRDVVFSEPLLLTESNQEPLGFGTFAQVDTVKIGESFYARKSINLPRQTPQQNRIREDIQKEIKIIHALNHPHVIRVILTYEETRRFSIIMHPLADCDLETYLANKTCDNENRRRLIWKWMVCLVNTLAYIHSKDIRHKDIKPRNVLVKGEKVYFTDFGSGHMFNDGGNSTTDGIAYGHTRAYCAPEVIKNDTRNRSSDVFSLGCVLVEMIVWSSQIAMSEYFDGIRAPENSTDVVSYHDSITRIATWFHNTPLLTERARDIYEHVLANMLRRKPDARWTAVQTSSIITKSVPSVECVKCSVDLWVSKSAG